jgi:hypothetical protein
MKTLVFLFALFSSLAAFSKYDVDPQEKEKHKPEPHSRLHIYNFPSPKTERGDKSLDPKSLSAHYFNIVQTCGKRDKSRAMKDKLIYDYEGDKNAIALRFLPGVED